MNTETIQNDPKYPENQKRAEQIASLRSLVDFLEQHPEVPVSPHLVDPKVWFWSFTDNGKEGFLSAAKALGTCNKKVEGNDFVVVKDFGSVKLTLSIPRNDICTLKKVVKTVEVDEWDCPSILSPEEIQQIGQEAAIS